MSSSSYSNKEISEWNSADLTNWLIDNKYRGISELCQKYSLSGERWWTYHAETAMSFVLV